MLDYFVTFKLNFKQSGKFYHYTIGERDVSYGDVIFLGQVFCSDSISMLLDDLFDIIDVNSDSIFALCSVEIFSIQRIGVYEK